MATIAATYARASGSIAGADQRAAAGYRADIDGLRAVAVLSITAFHFGFRSVPGGFVGVDVFFVISGYLIGGQVLRQCREGTFSLAAFYERRLRRIVPALAVMLLGVTLACAVLLLPVMLRQYGESLVAAALSLANVHFWLTTDYFAPAAESQPLLHTWSLGVEEQFYLALPLLPLAARRLRIGAGALVLAGIALSLALSIAVTASHGSFNFYLLPTRAWQLLLGTAAASLGPAIVWRQSWREAAAALGLALIALPLLLYGPGVPFPGLAALPPSLGTALVIAAGTGGETTAGKVLASRIAVFFGLISYSLYLWHWPVVVLMKQALAESWLRMPQRFAGLALSVLLGWASWYFVERPFRSRRVSARQVWMFSAAAGLLLVAAGAAIVAGQGFPGRFSPEVRLAASYLDRDRAQTRTGCIVDLFGKLADFDRARCLNAAPGRPSIVLVGDSHSDHLRYGLERRFPGANLMQASAAGCRTLLAGAADQTATCAAFRAELFDRILPAVPRGSTVILSNFWGAEALPDLGATLDWLRARGLRVILAGPVPRYEIPLPQALAASLVQGSGAPIGNARVPGTADLDARFAAAAKAHGAQYWSLYRALCPGGAGRTQVRGVPVQFDTAHLTDAGSLLVAEALDRL